VANVASAEKRNRQRLKRRQRNLAHKTKMRTHEKRVRALLASKDLAGAQGALKTAISLIDKAAQHGVIKAKTASRHVSRLTSAVNRLAATPAPQKRTPAPKNAPKAKAKATKPKAKKE
jgi:small subunit ribosomal protein S20